MLDSPDKAQIPAAATEGVKKSRWDFLKRLRPGGKRESTDQSPVFNSESIVIENLKVEPVQFVLTEEKKGQIMAGMAVYPEKFRASVGENSPKYAASVITSLEQSPEAAKPKLNVVFLPGAGGTHKSNVYIGTELFRQLQSQVGESQVNSVSIFSSTIGRDNPAGIPGERVEAAAIQAAFVVDLLKKNPAQQLILVGHSAGGLDMAFMMPMLKVLMKANNMDEGLIKGAVFFQPGGFYEQPAIPSFLPRVMDILSFRKEATEKFPTVFDIAKVEDQLWEAKGKGDLGQVHLLDSRMEEMKAKHNNPPIDNPLVKAAVIKSNQDIEKALYANQNAIPELLKQRQKILTKVIGTGIKEAENDQRPDLKANANWIRFALAHKLVPVLSVFGGYFKGTDGLISAMPRSMRKEVTFPVALVSSSMDAYFPREEMKRGLSNEQLKDYRQLKAEQGVTDEDFLSSKSKTFPEAPIVFDVDLPIPHMAIGSNYRKATNAIADITRRIIDYSTHQDSYPKHEVALYYP